MPPGAPGSEEGGEERGGDADDERADEGGALSPIPTQPIVTMDMRTWGELLPKALGVSNAEVVARTLVPPINVLARLVGPVAVGLSGVSKVALRAAGLRTEDSATVSEEQLRLIVGGAERSGG